MAGRRTNLALIVTLVASLLTGAASFAAGTPWGAWVVASHGVAGLCVIALGPWKSVIVRRGLRRARSGRAVSLGFGLLTLVALASGIAHSTGLVLSVGAVSTMQLHVGAALAAVPLGLWHVVARPTRVMRTDASRRQVLRFAALVGAAGVTYTAGERLLSAFSLPGGRRRFTGSHERGSFAPEAMPVTQWLDDRVPQIDPAGWSLAVRGWGTTSRWTYRELLRYDDQVTAVLDCTGGWWAEQRWSGARFDRLIEVSDARSIVVVSATGYRRRLPVADASTLLLATRMDGRELEPGHGFPVRLVAPGRRGFWWVKWVSEIELSGAPWWFQSPFPLS
jgi:hypothetical protein